MDGLNEKKINNLIRQLLDEEDDERRRYLADKVLAIAPDSAIAKYVKWQSDDSPDTIQDPTLLEEAAASLKPEIDALDESEAEESEIYALYVAMLTDLASLYYLSGDTERAFGPASEFMRLDLNGGLICRTVYYAILLERGDFRQVISAADGDVFETTPGEYCRALAEFELEGAGEKAAQRLLYAIALDPDAPYYILGLWELDDEPGVTDDDGCAEEMILVISVLSELWSSNEERLAFLSAIAFAFGYITGRIDGLDDIGIIEDTYRELGYLEEIQESRDILLAMIASGCEQEEVDEKAVSIFLENDYFRLFG